MATRRTTPARRPAARKRTTPRKRTAPPFVGKYLTAKGKVSSKGWVVIPKEIRDEMGIEPGDEVRFSLWPPLFNMKQDRELYSLHLHKVPENPAELGHGLFPRQPGEPLWTEQLLEDRRRELELEERKAAAPRRKRRSA
jgi:AbrB family looped-hinge helix DNA binding protein